MIVLKKFKSLISLLALAGCMIVASVANAYTPMISMRVFDANLGVVLAEVARMGKANVVVDVEPNATVSVDFKDVPFETALYFIARTKGLSIDKHENNTYIVTSQEKMEKGFGQVRIFPLKYARADHIKNILVGGGKSDSEYSVENPGASGGSEAGSLKTTAGGATASSANKEGLKGLVINTDASTNSLIAFGTVEQLEKVRSLLKELDVPYQQIVLEAQVMALSKSGSKSLGFDWTWSQFPPPSTTEGSTTTTTTTNYFPIAILTGGDGQSYKFGVNAMLSALITSGEGKLLARPNVMTFNGNKATIFIGDQLPIVTPTTSNGTTTNTTTYKNAGISLSYVPRINDDNYITASVFVEVSTPTVVTLGTGSGATTAYQITTRAAQTNVRMKDGETLVIGGLITSSDVKNVNKIPILGDLPILGKLFQSVSKSKNETEVVIFLKARIVK